MKSGRQQTLYIELECIDLPGKAFEQYGELRLGIQEGKDVIDDVPGDSERAVFRFPLKVTAHKTSAQPNFLGAFAQGKPDERFIYLCWGERRDGLWHGVRRAKIHLKYLTWDVIDAALQNDWPLRATIAMTDAKGAPLCASVRAEHIRWQPGH
jgi:hypothetical protein